MTLIISENIEHGYWKLKENQRKFLDNAGRKLGVREPKDWGNITFIQMQQAGCMAILNQYNSSPYEALTSIYSEIQWKREWFYNKPQYSYGYWKDTSNQRKFLDYFAKVHGISSPEKWASVTAKRIRNEGAFSMLSQYNHSLYEALRHIYPGEILLCSVVIGRDKMEEGVVLYDSKVSN